MAKRPRTYTDQFKEDALKLVETSGKSVAQVARDLGISPYTLHNWVQKAREDQPVITGEELSADERAELVELRKTVRRQAQELEVLGKAAKWFADRSL
jgi:transposase